MDCFGRDKNNVCFFFFVIIQVSFYTAHVGKYYVKRFQTPLMLIVPFYHLGASS